MTWSRGSLATTLLVCLAGAVWTAETPSLRSESLRTLQEFGSALQQLQITDPRDANAGALRCPACNVLHTRAAEAVYPFAVLHKQTGSAAYAASGLQLGRWLINRQEADGSWKETPEEWTGTTTDQLLMMARAYDILKPRMNPDDRQVWICQAAR